MTSNDAFFVTRPPCFLLHFFTNEYIGAPSPDILNTAQWSEANGYWGGGGGGGNSKNLGAQMLGGVWRQAPSDNFKI